MWRFGRGVGVSLVSVLALTSVLVWVMCAAAASAGGGEIAFSSTRAGGEDADIYVVRADGRGQTRLTSAAASKLDPDLVAPTGPGWRSPGSA
jgi:hypothetical protein